MATRGLRAYLQQYPAVPAPAPRKMKGKKEPSVSTRGCVVLVKSNRLGIS